MKYAFYRPADNLKPRESFYYDTFHVGEETEEYRIVFKPIDPCPWPLPGEPKEPEPNLWERAKAFIMNQAELPDDRLYDLVVSWIYATWIPEAFQAVPYLQFLGPRNSGKTRMLEVLQALSYRGFLSPSVTDATLFRVVDRWKPTLLLDESEIYTREEKTTVQNLLNAGYRRGQVIPRMLPSHDGFKLELFQPFGFKALAATRGFKGTLESRCIAIHMEKNSAPINLFIDEKEAKEIRSQLLTWRWRRLSDVYDVYDVVPGVIPPELSFCDGRFAELYAPLVTVANEGREKIVEYAREEYRYTIDEEKTSEEAQITESLLKSAPNVEKRFISTSVIAENYNTGLSEKEKIDNRRVGWIMKRLGFRPKRKSTQRGWIYDERRIEKLSRRYGLGTPGKTSQTSQTSFSESYGVFEAHRQASFDAQTQVEASS